MGVKRGRAVLGVGLSIGVVLGLSGVVLVFTALSEVFLRSPETHPFSIVGLVITVIGLALVIAGWSFGQNGP